jgi:DNA-binding LacI/PurR family transcriptional regulator
VMPALTTVRQPLRQIGEIATRLLVARMAGEPVAAETHLQQPELVVRGSTAPPT